MVLFRLNPSSPLAKSVSLGAADTLKLQLTTVDGKKSQRPHQAFLTLTDSATGLEESFVLSVKESGKGKVDLVCKPTQLLPTSLMFEDPQGPSTPIPHFREADRRIHCHWLFWIIYAIQGQGV